MRAVVALLACATFACSEAQLVGAGDASAATCATTPISYCDAAPSDAGGCGAVSDGGDPLTARIPDDASFPVGCTVYLPEPTPASDGTCTDTSACTCSVTSADAGAWTYWECRRP